MITKLVVNNYRSIGHCELDFGPFTVLVGPNGAGKSNIVDALRFISECATFNIEQPTTSRLGFGVLLHQGRLPASRIDMAIECKGPNGQGFWGFSIGPDPTGNDYIVEREFAYARPYYAPEEPAANLDSFFRSANGADLPASLFDGTMRAFYRVRNDFRIATGYSPALSMRGAPSLVLPYYESTVLSLLFEPLRNIAVYDVFPNVLRPPQPRSANHRMSSTGDNWASILADLDRNQQGAELVHALNRIVGDIDDYRVTRAGGYMIPEFRHGKTDTKERWFGAAQESDGTLRIAAILTALLHQPPPSMLGFEEPELAVHPGALPILFDFLTEAATHSQVVVTTQSPDLIDLTSIDDIRVVTRNAGETTVSRVEERQRDLVKGHLFSTSELLHAEGLRQEEPTR